MLVNIGVITCRRLDGLRKLLVSLSDLELGDSGIDMLVTVVDNDPEASAERVVAEARRTSGLVIHYAVEPRPGIPHARNAVIRMMPLEAEFLAFVDDDEFVDPLWLQHLLTSQRLTSADAVTGPVLPVFSSETPLWIRKSRLFERGRRSTGMVLRTAATNNILVRAGILRRLDIRFDSRLALSGGSDTHLFTKLVAHGARIVWCDEAVVYEDVPLARATVKWLLQRQFRKGVVDVFLQQEFHPSAAHRVRLVLMSIGRLTKGLIILPVLALKGRAGVVTALQRSARGAGALMRMLGANYEEYKAVHPPDVLVAHERSSLQP